MDNPNSEWNIGDTAYWNGKPVIIKIRGHNYFVEDENKERHSVNPEELKRTLDDVVEEAQPKISKAKRVWNFLKPKRTKKQELPAEPRESKREMVQRIQKQRQEAYERQCAEEERIMSRRAVILTPIAKVIEFASFAPAGAAVALTLWSRNSYPQAELKQLETGLEEHKKALNNLEGTLASVHNDLKQLWNAYDQHYRKVETETYTEMEDVEDEERNVIDTELVTKERDVVKWYVPSGMPGRHTVQGWRDNAAETLEKIAEAKNVPIYEYDKDKVKIKEENANFALEVLVTLAVYGIPGVMLLQYEETIEFFSKHFGRHKYKAKDGILRRALLKIAAVTVASIPVYIMTKGHQNKSKERFTSAEKDVYKILHNTKNLPANTIMSEVVGETPKSLLLRINNLEIEASKHGEANAKDVAEAFKSLNINAKTGYANLARMFDNGNSISPNLEIPLRNAYGAKKINEYNSQGSKDIYYGRLIEGGIFAGVLAALLIPSEIILQMRLKKER